jgi:4-hydroxy-L-threonine phosphate dehydrogenase PdxA
MMLYDIAWQGKAAPTSLYAAIRIAAQLAAGRSATAVPITRTTDS